MKKNLFSVAALLTMLIAYSLIPSTAFSQAKPKTDTLKFFYGAFLGYNINMHNAAFNKLSGECPTCNPIDYGNSTGGGIAGGILFEYPIFSNKIRTPMAVGLRIGYEDISSDFSTEENIGNTYTTGIEQAYSNHILETSLAELSFNPYFSYSFYGFVGNIGPKLGYLLTHKFNQREELDRPASIVFTENGTRVRNRYDDVDIDKNKALQFGINIGVGYELPIGKYSVIMPEINYTLNVTNIADVDWKVSTLRFGIAAKFPICKDEVIPITPQKFYHRDTTNELKVGISAPEIVLLNSSKSMEGVDTIITEHYVKYLPKEITTSHSLTYTSMKGSDVYADSNIIIEEYATTERFPVLPIVYFTEGKSTLSDTKQHQLTKAQTATFNINTLKPDAVQVHYDLLNIIGSRMRQYPKATITVTGFSNNEALNSPEMKVATDRIKAVIDYLTNVWDVSANRINRRDDGTLTRTTTVSSSADVNEENHKIEISTATNELIFPITLADVEQAATPDKILFNLDAANELGITINQFTISQDGKLLRNITDNTKQTTYKNTFVWNILDSPAPVGSNAITAQYAITTANNENKVLNRTIPITYRSIESGRNEIKDNYKIERYSLVLFEFNRSDLLTLHKLILNDVIKSIQPNSKVIISGYTDRTGDVEYNKNLAQNRCESVKNYIDGKIKNIDIELDAVGSSRIIFNNDTPEGRALSRTVRIEVRTPIK
ncbi:MAG: OmpA family protein [Ignavibacteria bacterium]|jgi:outer membrane protein OmpA-like peptidoglycan-associated protein|nr:OmpA family protein [Ignavibacteria bacterium]